MSRSQQERIDAMSDDERASWGFAPGESVSDKQARDERENPSSGGERPLLTYLGGETTEMGGIMYVLPIGKISGAARDFERWVFSKSSANKGEGNQASASAESPASEERKKSPLILKLAAAHRLGHVEGFRLVQDLEGTNLLTAILKNAATTNVPKKDLVYQVAALLESCNPDMQESFLTKLRANSLWNSAVQDTELMNEVNLVGLPEELVNEVFPNAHVANIPEMNDEPRGYWLNKYKRLIRGMTAKRAKRFIS